MNNPQRVLVIGASGGTGRAVVSDLIDSGHQVTAFARRATSLQLNSDQLKIVTGDAMNAKDVAKAVKGQDAVIVTLGIRENPLRVRLLGSKNTASNIRSTGTANVIQAMKQHGVSRLVVQSSFGVGQTRHLLRLGDRLLFKFLLKPQILDTEEQEKLVRESGLDWVIAQPVHLTDAAFSETPSSSIRGKVNQWNVSRRSVARFLSKATHSTPFLHQSVTL